MNVLGRYSGGQRCGNQLDSKKMIEYVRFGKDSKQAGSAAPASRYTQAALTSAILRSYTNEWFQ